MESWGFLFLTIGGFGGIRRGSEGFEGVRRDSEGFGGVLRVSVIIIFIIIVSVIVRHRDRQIYDPAVQKKSGNARKPVFRKRRIPIRKRQPDLILLAPPARVPRVGAGRPPLRPSYLDSVHPPRWPSYLDSVHPDGLHPHGVFRAQHPLHDQLALPLVAQPLQERPVSRRPAGGAVKLPVRAPEVRKSGTPVVEGGQRPAGARVENLKT
eukprot:1177827-Prorocentrum_minimum.AAC.2